ncbi:hypothetical protein [Microbispora rosea]
MLAVPPGAQDLVQGQAERGVGGDELRAILDGTLTPVERGWRR